MAGWHVAPCLPPHPAGKRQATKQPTSWDASSSLRSKSRRRRRRPLMAQTPPDPDQDHPRQLQLGRPLGSSVLVVVNVVLFEEGWKDVVLFEEGRKDADTRAPRMPCLHPPPPSSLHSRDGANERMNVWMHGHGCGSQPSRELMAALQYLFLRCCGAPHEELGPANRRAHSTGSTISSTKWPPMHCAPMQMRGCGNEGRGSLTRCVALLYILWKREVWLFQLQLAKVLQRCCSCTRPPCGQ